MAYNIVVVVLTLIFLALLELSKNTLAGWVIAVILAGAMIFGRYRLADVYHSKRYLLIMWVLFIAVLAIDYKMTAPKEQLVPAVDVRNPEKTDVISISQGDLTGVYNKDKTVKVYAGIPYAKAPVGDLRFKEPQAPESWSGIRPCDHFGPMAMQTRGSVLYDSLSHILGWHDYRVKFGDEYIEKMSEDCLYLNVFAPENTENEELLPVIFYVHGGSLSTGQSSYSEYRGEDLAKKGVVFVNFAYRLNVFGYYAADDLAKESPNGTTGNYGLLDQIAALKWVRENIKAFGGDPERITIAGESAGSSSVNALCVSPLTEGDFNYAIAESSGILVKKPFHTFRSYEKAIAEGDKVRAEFNVSSSAELRDIPADKLLSTQTQHSSMTVDGYAIKEMPYLTYEKGENHEKALLNGFNAKEADPFMMGYKATSENYEQLIANAVGEKYAKEIAAIVPADTPERDQHFIVDQMGPAKGALNTVYSALWFSYSHYVWSKTMANQGKPVYEYYFTKTNNSLSNYHAGELPYAYGNLWRHPELYDDEDYALSEIMQNYYVNFAKTGNPNGNGLPAWDPVTAAENKVLQLDTKIEMTDDPNMEIYKIIDKYQEE